MATLSQHPKTGRTVRLAALALLTASAMCLTALPSWASGSIGPGAARTGKSAAQADYARGKSIVHKELVCRGCPIKKRAFNKARARSLKESLDRALEEPRGVREAPDEVRALCRQGVRDEGECKQKLRMVRYYLERRYRLR